MNAAFATVLAAHPQRAVIVDAQRIDEGPIATIMLPFKAPPQIHGIWVSGDQLPQPKSEAV